MASVARRPERVFEKVLSKTDVECRLAFPSNHVHQICSSSSNQHEPPSSMDFQVEDVDGNRFRLCLNLRISGKHRKPEVTRGWLDMVRSKNLKKHDKLIFYKHTAGGGDLHFTVAVRRAVRLFGVVIGYKSSEE